MMKPTPQKSPTPSRFWNAMPMLTPFAAARNESFCATSSPPTSASLIATMRPGTGAPNATRRLPDDLLRKIVMNSTRP